MEQNQINALSMVVNSMAADKARRMYAYGMRGTSNTKRTRIYQEFGYPEELSFDDYYKAYDRNGIGGAAVDKMNDTCWVDYPEIYEGDKSLDKEAESAWDKRVNRLMKRCWRQIKDADRRNLVGRYSALLIQLRDSKKWNEPVDTNVIRNLTEKALVRLIPVWEAQIDPSDWDTDETSENYNQPTMYSYIELPVEGGHSGAPGRVINVHPDRVIFFTEGSSDGQLSSGRSLLRQGFNSLLDLEKVSGGSSEGFLKNASRQLNYSFSEKTDFPALARALGTDESGLADALNEQVERLNRSTDSASFMQAGTADVLSVAAADPEPTWRTSLSTFAATVPIPVKVLIGQITGERASSEDMKDWGKTCMSRRNNFLTDVVTDIITHFWNLGIIPPAANEEITVDWSDLLAPSQSEKLDNMSKAAEVAQKSQQAYGRPAITENEIRTFGELKTLPELDDELPPPPEKDPLNDDKDTGASPNIPK